MSYTLPTPPVFASDQTIHKDPLSKQLLAKSILSVMLAIGLNACQSIPASQSAPTTPKLQTAHDLLSYSLLHRFDQSYDYQKSTHYQVKSLYETNDIEANDNSLFMTFLTILSGDTKFPKTRDISPKVADCEQQYTQRYLEITQKANHASNNNQLNPSNKPLPNWQQQTQSKAKKTNDDKKSPAHTITNTPSDPELATAKAHYEACLAHAKADESLNGVSSDVTDADYNLEGENSGFLGNSQFTTISSIIASQQPDKSYQTSIKKLTDYFNALADASAKTNEDKNLENQKLDNQKADDSLKYPFGKPPKKITPQTDTDTNSDASSDNDEDDSETMPAVPMSRAERLAQQLRNLRITPEQIQVLNDAFLTPKTLQYQGSFDKATGQLSSVLTESNDSGYSQSYKRVPMLIDFNEMSMTLEPDAVLPIASLLSDKALPKNLAGKSVKFTLPDNLRQNIPLPILKDSLLSAIAHAYSDIDSEKFTETLVDDYGKSLHASRAVKINLTTQDVGFMVGRTLKYWSQSLSRLRQAHPEYINNDSSFAATLDLMAAANRIYRADDLAKLAQFIEAIIPISYNGYNYYYFNQNNQLIGYRKIRDYRSSLLKAVGNSVTTSQITYRTNHQTTKPHLYYQPKPQDIIDGNALLQQMTSEKKLAAEAQDARFGYTDVQINDDRNDDESKSDSQTTQIN